MSRRIYLASSWRNTLQSSYIRLLRDYGHEVYDFTGKEPMPAGGPYPTAFAWDELDPKWNSWRPSDFRHNLLSSSRAAFGFLGDSRGMAWADTCLLLLPCGNSAHLEAGFMKGLGKRLIIHYHDNDGGDGYKPDLMYLLADNITIGKEELIDQLSK